VNLPKADIVVVHRRDGSGTSYCFTDYLAKISPEWQMKVSKTGGCFGELAPGPERPQEMRGLPG
jgi:ABC-type phosphate transport system substrate-binding protein